MHALTENDIRQALAVLDVDAGIYHPGELESLLSKTDDPRMILKIGAEIKCLELFLSDGFLKPIMEFTNAVRTDIEKLSDEELEYINDRAGMTDQTALVARYNHILYLRKKHRKYAVNAISAYHALADDYFDRLVNEEKCIHDVMEVLKAGHHLSGMVNHETTAEKKRIIDWFKKDDQELFFYQHLVELIGTSKLFKRVDVVGLTEKALALKELADDEQDADYYLGVCLSLAKKEGYTLSAIYQLIAENQLALIVNRPDPNGVFDVSSLLKAAIFYKKAGEKEKSNEVLRSIEQRKPDLYMNSVEHTYDASEERVMLRDGVKQMIDDDRFVIFVHLALNPHMLLTTDDIQPDPDSAFLKGIQTTFFDRNINPRFLTKYEEDKKEKFFDIFIHYEQVTIFYIQETKRQMADTKRDFLAEGLAYFRSSWFGTTLAKPVLSEEPELYQWYPALEPALKLLINIGEEHQLKALSAEEQMAFDQLAVKFEGPLRDYCQLSKVTTTRIKEEQVLYMDINELLASEEVAALFKKEDFELWQYVLTGSGYNIRNDVAHGFYRLADYTVGKAQLLLLAYIRLAKYSQVVSQKPTDKARAL
jgi:hypothetical protein